MLVWVLDLWGKTHLSPVKTSVERSRVQRGPREALPTSSLRTPKWNIQNFERGLCPLAMQYFRFEAYF